MSKFAKPIPKFGPDTHRLRRYVLAFGLLASELNWQHSRASACQLTVAHAVRRRDWRAHRWEGEAASAEHFNRDGRFVGATTFALSSDEFVQVCSAHLASVRQAACTEHTLYTAHRSTRRGTVSVGRFGPDQHVQPLAREHAAGTAEST